ncbi:3-phosphoserine/phosphohydroxythreonine transaminase [Paraferrimonas sedimenticola]|uniref:Phosphoserine aminotransferase n=1 Tax=Paraferrimonas sedimenticola TaxID=375674 RepID=A0AA37RWF9_9GAMM|nr:3-phosphoserine/phosphohydroxythreonine transaminase [Paraferrimonas sedimenticola]GLP96621.1 phosphoserine aminotransferase [Paraferrimonas sedimenticola]
MRVFNFCAGPAMLPTEVMAQAQAELLDWQGQGVSVMEMSHRSPEFIALAKGADADLRELLTIPDDYHVLFMHGGGRGQFAAVAMNLLGDNGKALYLRSGSWSKAAAEEARRFGEVDEIEVIEERDGTKALNMPSFSAEQGDYRYLHYCPNETVDGIEISEVPDSPWPIVADMSSCILSRPIDVSKYGLIYAGAQKNIGPSGLSLVIVKRDLLELPSLPMPSIMDYRITAENESMFNTPPTYALYIAASVFAWLKKQGGVAAMGERNQRKADELYDYINQSDFYKNPVASNLRSRMNVTFQLADESLNSEFLSQAKARGLLALKGHRSVGGMRASIYNAMPHQGVLALVAFMDEFAKAQQA